MSITKLWENSNSLNLRVRQLNDVTNPQAQSLNWARRNFVNKIMKPQIDPIFSPGAGLPRDYDAKISEIEYRIERENVIAQKQGQVETNESYGDFVMNFELRDRLIKNINALIRECQQVFVGETDGSKMTQIFKLFNDLSFIYNEYLKDIKRDSTFKRQWHSKVIQMEAVFVKIRERIDKWDRNFEFLHNSYTSNNSYSSSYVGNIVNNIIHVCNYMLEDKDTTLFLSNTMDDRLEFINKGQIEAQPDYEEGVPKRAMDEDDDGPDAADVDAAREEAADAGAAADRGRDAARDDDIGGAPGRVNEAPADAPAGAGAGDVDEVADNAAATEAAHDELRGEAGVEETKTEPAPAADTLEAPVTDAAAAPVTETTAAAPVTKDRSIKIKTVQFKGPTGAIKPDKFIAYTIELNNHIIDNPKLDKKEIEKEYIRITVQGLKSLAPSKTIGDKINQRLLNKDDSYFNEFYKTLTQKKYITPVILSEKSLNGFLEKCGDIAQENRDYIKQQYKTLYISKLIEKKSTKEAPVKPAVIPAAGAPIPGSKAAKAEDEEAVIRRAEAEKLKRSKEREAALDRVGLEALEKKLRPRLDTTTGKASRSPAKTIARGRPKGSKNKKK